MEAELEPKVADNPAANRFEARADGGRLMGYTEYVLEPGSMVVTHTVVAQRFEGRGVGSSLAKFALDAARARGLHVTPVCPFTRSYVRRHPGYEDMVDWPDGLSDADDGDDPESSG